MKQRARVRVKGSLTSEAVIGRGTRQGCSLSPELYNIYAGAMYRCSKQFERNCPCGKLFIKVVRSADNQATLASSTEGIQHMMDKLQETSADYGMKINIARPR